MSPFTPTNWVEGGAPGISAAELDRIEAGILELTELNPDRIRNTLSGPMPPAGSRILMATGHDIWTANVAGDVGITIPGGGFPNALISVQVQGLDAAPLIHFQVHTYDPQVFNCRMYFASGVALGDGNSARVSWTAVGW